MTKRKVKEKPNKAAKKPAEPAGDVDKPIISAEDGDELIISDPERVYKMALLYERQETLKWRSQMQIRNCDDRIMQAKHEKKSILQAFETETVAINKALRDLKTDIEETYNIKLSEWGFDEELGVIQKLPESELPEDTKKEGN